MRLQRKMGKVPRKMIKLWRYLIILPQETVILEREMKWSLRKKIFHQTVWQIYHSIRNNYLAESEWKICWTKYNVTTYVSYRVPYVNIIWGSF